MRPLFDGLYDFLGQEQAHRYLETGVIDSAPLMERVEAYSWGLDDFFREVAKRET